MTAYSFPLSVAQIDALAHAKAWIENDTTSQQVFRLFGYAGSGKTTLARHIAALVDDQVSYAAFTGKAAYVMRQNGCGEARTLHSLIYQPIARGNGQVDFHLKTSGEIHRARLIIVDECSMIDDRLAADLLSFGIPILALGDPAQLPPINDPGHFSTVAPDVLLTEVHRQAQGNPVLRLATLIRNGHRLEAGTYGTSRVMDEVQLSPEILLAADQIIVGRNDTRHVYNQIMRSLHGFSGDLPVKGERLICRKNHNQLGIFNGELFQVLNTPVVKGDDVTFEVMSELERTLSFEVTISAMQFVTGRQAETVTSKRRPVFDFAYALTCHSAQGSQWRNVLVVDESGCFPNDAKRWLYTAATRAQEQLTIAT